MQSISAHRLAARVPLGWEARIFRRAEAGEPRTGTPGPAAPPGERSFPIVHIASIPLPIDMADYGSDVVEDLGPDDVFVVLKEFNPADAGQPLFARDGMPRSLTPEDFDPNALQRPIGDQAGHQTFFHEGGRAFCLYVVLGDYRRRRRTVGRVNEVLANLDIDAVPPPPR